MNAISTEGSKVAALSPLGFPPSVKGKSLAGRLETLENKTIYLVDCRFDDSANLLRQLAIWFETRMPTVTVKQVSLSGYYGKDDPELWAEIKANGDAAIVGVGHCSTCAPAVSTHAVTLETLHGVPTVALHTDKFDRVVKSVTRVAGLPEAPCVFVPQPVMGKSDEELAAYIKGDDPINGDPVIEGIIKGLTRMPAASSARRADRQDLPRVVTGRSEDELHEVFLRRDWTDKLPIVLPTEERVQAMLAGTSRSRNEIVGKLQPTPNRGLWEFTVEQVAVNAVMAGAKPEYFPVILALAASGVTARGSTSSSGAAMVVVNGPIRQEIGMNCGIGAMGPYNHANATIGRAYGLLSQNLQGGSAPGETFMGSQGNGHTYNNLTYAENEERSPWEPLHVQKGFKPEQSAVSVFYGCRSTTFSLGLRKDHWREHVADMLHGVDIVSAPTLVLDPICARQFVERGGFDTKEKLARFIHDSALMPAARYWDLQLVQNYIYPSATQGTEPMASKLAADPDSLIPMFREEQINVVVAGGESNGYWQIIGAHHRAVVSIDDWR